MEEGINLATPRVVLLIEEEPLLNFYTAEFLQDTFVVVEAATAEDALAVLQTRTDVDVVMASLDITGTIDGLELAKIISLRWPGMALILYSDRAPPADADLPSSSIFVKKPYTPAKIVALIERLVKDNASDPDGHTI